MVLKGPWSWTVWPILLLKISATWSRSICFFIAPCPCPLRYHSKNGAPNCPFRALTSLALSCLDLPKPRPFLISISGPQWRMRSPWCEMKWQYHDLAGHKTTAFKAKFCNLKVYPRGCVIQSKDHEAICKILTFLWTKCGSGDVMVVWEWKNWELREASKAQIVQGWDQHSWFLLMWQGSPLLQL